MDKFNHFNDIDNFTKEIIREYKQPYILEHIAFIFEGYRDAMLYLNNIGIEEDGYFGPDIDKYSNRSARRISYDIGFELAKKDLDFINENKTI